MTVARPAGRPIVVGTVALDILHRGAPGEGVPGT